MGGQREKLAALANQQYLFVTQVAGQHGPVNEITSRNALREVGSSRFFVLSCHLFLRPRPRTARLSD
jgi:hypothetical protein